jgi:hypothetical protein
MKLLLALIVLFASASCSVVSYYAGAYGKKAEKGSVIVGPSFSYTVPQSYFRVHLDDNGLVAYEDYGPGMGRGRVFVVRAGPSEAKDSPLDDLRQFGRSPAQVLRDGRLVAVSTSEWRGTPVKLHLIEVPEISRCLGDANSKVVDRERAWVLGMVVTVADQRFWISLTSNDEFFSPEAGLGGRNLQSLLEFAQDLSFQPLPKQG